MGSDALDDVIGWRDGHIIAIDQTALPHRLTVLDLTTTDELVDAITRLVVRGAPLLGVAGALGLALAVGPAGRGREPGPGATAGTTPAWRRRSSGSPTPGRPPSTCGARWSRWRR